MVKPGGTGNPRFAISARFAPLPPSKSRIAALPSALPSPKVKTHFWRVDLAAALTGFAAAAVRTRCLRLAEGAAARGGGFARATGFFFGAGFALRAAVFAMVLNGRFYQ